MPVLARFPNQRKLEPWQHHLHVGSHSHSVAALHPAWGPRVCGERVRKWGILTPELKARCSTTPRARSLVGDRVAGHGLGRALLVGVAPLVLAPGVLAVGLTRRARARRPVRDWIGQAAATAARLGTRLRDPLPQRTPTREVRSTLHNTVRCARTSRRCPVHRRKPTIDVCTFCGAEKTYNWSLYSRQNP